MKLNFESKAMRVPFRQAILFCALALIAASIPAALAQERIGRPIYPAYQGFLENPDGSITMVFQYFSHGRDPVTIEPGPDNGFNGAEDRNQPTTFLPGNHEFVCVMIVNNAEEATQLKWTVAFPVEANLTTQDPLNPEYRLVERNQKEAMRNLDLATSPRHVCINKPPRVVADSRNRFGRREEGETPAREAKIGEELALRGFVQDEGLPRGSTLLISWKKMSGPGDVVFTEPHSAQTAATFSAEGEYELELHATDGELENSGRVKVKVGA